SALTPEFELRVKLPLVGLEAHRQVAVAMSDADWPICRVNSASALGRIRRVPRVGEQQTDKTSNRNDWNAMLHGPCLLHIHAHVRRCTRRASVSGHRVLLIKLQVPRGLNQGQLPFPGGALSGE